jgi:hypothetical protein
MAPKYHPTPLSGGDRKALQKEMVKSRAMTKIPGEQSEQKRRVGEAIDPGSGHLACQSWNENVERRRADRSVSHYRAGDQRRLPLASNSLLTL